MGKGKPTYVNAAYDFYGHIHEPGVDFKNYVESVEVDRLTGALKFKCFRHGGRQLHTSFGP